MKEAIIDRFEKGSDQDYAILELKTREIIILPKNLLPDKSKQGDKIILNDDNIPM